MRPIGFAVLAIVAACVPALADEKADVQALNDKFAAEFNAGNFAAVAGHYAQDAVALPPGAPLQREPKAIQEFWTAAGAQVSDLKLTAQDVKALGPDALQEIGSFSLRTKGAQPQSVQGKYVVIWRKEGGNWKLATDIWNTDQ
ncbi:DUF4440 domain-containing protein [Alsobacter sp. SYSU M60028]|uniref:DUF4440 domain-containing protein n=1 Tax=Alsobacter ponti TaxID=2962936 RepID=A0ABT1LHW4_9HYPH|nr:DUF4440 domain-containing protein [Alsobacter ponti]MCP8941097.1 DUF4440 domain-containing protein [Alsobacter ponti]